MRIGGVYRENQMLFKGTPNPNKEDSAQLGRLNQIMDYWKLAARDPLYILIGDLNIDYLKSHSPSQAHTRMVDRIRDGMESKGFTQVIKGHTRSWRGQTDSLVDHCWLDKPERLVSFANEDRASSDHNHISDIIRTKDKLDAEMSHRGDCGKMSVQIDLETKSNSWTGVSYMQVTTLMSLMTYLRKMWGGGVEFRGPNEIYPVQKIIQEMGKPGHH